MCIDYTDLNRACQKDSYLFLNIDQLVDNSVNYQFLSFIDTYFRYNKIPMFRPDNVKTMFKTRQANYRYNVIPFRLKNSRAT